MSDEFERIKRTNVVVYSMLRRGRSLEDIIVMLCNEREILLKRALELEQIAPRMILSPDGTVRVWRCPDSLVPDNTSGNAADQPKSIL
jgi:hypothetical protein